MNIRKATIAFGLFTALSTADLATAAPQTLTGVVTDDMCGKKHTMMPGKTDGECIRACVKAGSKYSLLVGDKIYVLMGNSNSFDRYAGKKVRVSGDMRGTVIAVRAIGETK
jgi:hypothetical protein